MTSSRRQFFMMAALAASSSLPAAQAQTSAATWPARPIKIIVPVPAGGQIDAIARLLGLRLEAKLGQPVVVDNKPGANTMIATEAVARSAADGYTLLLTYTAFAVNTLQYKKVPYDPFKDFVPVSRIGDNVAVFAVPPALQVNTLKEFVALAKTSKMNFASPGTGSTTHMYGAILAETAGISLDHIPYKGDSSLLPDLMSNRVNSGFLSAMTASQLSKEGKLKLLAVNRSQRAPSLPDVPTFAESGVPDMGAEGWVGMLAPAGTPMAIVDRLASEIDAALNVPDIRSKLMATGLIPVGGTSADFTVNLRKTYDGWGQIVKRTNIRMD